MVAITRRRGLAGLAALLLLTAITALPWDPQGPFDARDYSTLATVALDYPGWALPLEPLLAPAHAIFGAPDFRLSAVSTLSWLIAAALVMAVVRGRRAGRRWWAVVGGGVWAGVAAAALGLGYLAAAAVLELPGWRLVVAEPGWHVADLQSHTYASHDGVAAPERNFAWHAERGYDMVAVTEHNDPAGSFAARRLAETLGGPLLIPGVEVSSEQDEYLLGIGLREGVPVLRYRGNEREYARRFIEHVHKRHGGAVIAMAWKLKPEQVVRLAERGVDGFELVNTGHPDVPDAVRAAMLDAVRDYGVIPVASTDWHGWSGFTRTSTLIRAAGDGADPVEAAVARLRARDGAAFVPVVAGYVGEPGAWRVALAPLAETVRYAGELSWPRLLAWWGWAALLALAATRLGHRAGRVAAITVALAVTAALATAYIKLWLLPETAPGTEYAREMAGHLEAVLALCSAVTVVALVRGRFRAVM